MPFITVDNYRGGGDVDLSYIDAGEGQPVVLIHGWPLSHRMWEKQVTALVDAGYRVIAYDRRGFGESGKPWDGYDYDTLAADLDKLMVKLDLQNAVLVGFSMGGGEVVRYLTNHGSQRIAKIVLMSAVTPYLMKTDDNPDGVESKILQAIMDNLLADRPGFLEMFNKQFYNWDKDGKDLLSEPFLQHSWDMGVWASPRATVKCAEAFSSTDFRRDLANITLPTLVIHGDADQTVPFENSGKRTHDAIPGSELVIIEGGAHGIPATQAEQINQLLLNFLQR